MVTHDCRFCHKPGIQCGNLAVLSDAAQVRSRQQIVRPICSTKCNGSACPGHLLQGTRPMSKTTGADGKTVLKAGPYQWVTYGEVQKRVDAVGSGMLHLGLAPANDLGVSCDATQVAKCCMLQTTS